MFILTEEEKQEFCSYTQDELDILVAEAESRSLRCATNSGTIEVPAACACTSCASPPASFETGC